MYDLDKSVFKFKEAGPEYLMISHQHSPSAAQAGQINVGI